ncbi:MAG: KOW domain-containing RNA-binding protein [Clostridia bacterium]|nr:KOW domain-containing RNA-binding protein [Clostridia bacterium]
MEGRIVRSLAGRDKGYFLVVVSQDGNFLSVCDGKERPLARPKRKNIKHLALTNTVLNRSEYETDKQLRKALAVYRASVWKGRNQDV